MLVLLTRLFELCEKNCLKSSELKCLCSIYEKGKNKNKKEIKILFETIAKKMKMKEFKKMGKFFPKGVLKGI